MGIAVREVSVDVAIHGLAIAGAIIGSAVLLHRAGHGPVPTTDIVLFVVGLFAMLICSALYNSRIAQKRRQMLRRLDHAAIFLLIAGTYAPVLGSVGGEELTAVAYRCVWIIAAIGIVLKLFAPGKFERGFVLLYLALGWSGLAVLDTLLARLPVLVLALIGLGGFFYTIGVAFHLWERLPYQTAIWHGFVVCAAATHFAAVLVLVG